MPDPPPPAALSDPSQHAIEWRINREIHRLDAASRVSLRDRLQSTGTKKGCGRCPIRASSAHGAVG